MKCPYCGSESIIRLKRVDLNKIVRGLQKACEKRPVSMEQIHKLTDVCARTRTCSARMSQLAGNWRSNDEDLKKIDRFSYVRFASVYKSFEEPGDFTRVLKEVRT